MKDLHHVAIAVQNVDGLDVNLLHISIMKTFTTFGKGRHTDNMCVMAIQSMASVTVPAVIKNLMKDIP